MKTKLRLQIIINERNWKFINGEHTEFANPWIGFVTPGNKPTRKYTMNERNLKRINNLYENYQGRKRNLSNPGGTIMTFGK